jgi:cytochrome c oxidase subunit III
MSASASALAGGSTAHAELTPEQEAPSNEWLGMVLFIVSEAVMFGAFFAQYFYARILSDTWPNPIGLPPGFERVPAAPLPVIMTVLLVASGFTAHWAQTAIHRNDRGSVEGWLIITLLLGLGFLGVQAYEYASFILVDGFTISSGIYGTIFFSLTGLHGFHVIVGVVLLTGVMIRTFLGHFTSRNCFGIDGTILYWHFVDAVWIALYLTLYLL